MLLPTPPPGGLRQQPGAQGLWVPTRAVRPARSPQAPAQPPEAAPPEAVPPAAIPPDLLPGPAWDLEEAEEITGEVYAIAERLVLAPCAGRFLLPAVGDADECESLVNGEYLGVGDRVGDVIDTGDNIIPVASRHAGWLKGFLVPHGCPVRAAEPICWLLAG